MILDFIFSGWGVLFAVAGLIIGFCANGRDGQ